MLRPCKSSKTASCGTTTTDLISKLPDELLYSIISCLKLRDIVKLSVLSSRFKHICSTITLLQFDWDNMFVTDSWEISENPPCTIFKDKFVRGINQFLQFYQGKQIYSFKLSCCLGSECSNDIDQWLRFALSRGAEELSLNLYCDKYCSKFTNDNGQLNEGKYVLGKELFEGVTTNLKDLSLYACILEPNFTYQFSCLEALRLSQLPLSLYDLHGLFSCLVNLKKLFFSKCSLPSKLCLGALTRLKYFAVLWSSGLEVVDLSNDNLLTFSWIFSSRVTCDLRGAHNLMQLWYHANEWTCQYLFTCLPQHFPRLRKLIVYSWSNWVEWVPKTISIFSQVTKLELNFFQYPKFSILKIISILGAFPCLCTLALATCCPEDVDEEKLKPGEYVPKHLTKVVISGFYSTPNQMEFAIFLLKSAAVLRRLIIKQDAKPYVPKRQSWDEGEREMVYERLQEFDKDGVLVVQ